MLGARYLALTSIFALASTLVAAVPQASTTLPSSTGQNAPQALDLNGPEIVYTGSWVNQPSPCELDSVARRTDNKRADDAKAVIEFEAGVRGFELSAEASSRTTGYTVTADAIDFKLGQANNTEPEAGSTQCSPVFTYYFASQGAGGHTIAISFVQLRSAKRDFLEERQSFELPWLQINHINALYTVPGDSQATPGSSTASPSASPGNNEVPGRANSITAASGLLTLLFIVVALLLLQTA